MNTKFKHLMIGAFLVVFCVNSIYAQDQSFEDNKKLYSKLVFFDYRGTNAIDVAVGSSVINGDFQDPLFEIYFKIGYKRFLTEHINIGFAYNKYNIAYKDVYNEGFMSFDVNVEYIFLPYERFTPFIYAGAGYNSANYFENTSTKIQGALGIEYIVSEKVGLRLFGEYNHNMGDELDGLIAGQSDDVLYRMGIGVNFYFGGNKRKQKMLSDINTVIQSNLVK